MTVDSFEVTTLQTRGREQNHGKQAMTGPGQLDTEGTEESGYIVIEHKMIDCVKTGLKLNIFLHVNLNLFYAEMINTKHTNAKDCLQKNTKDFKLRKYQNLE